MSDRVVAVVPVKLNSLRLPGKNIRPLGGVPLVVRLARTLSECRRTGVIDACYVFCSDESIREYTDGLLDFLQRDQSLDTDITRSQDILNAFSSKVPADIYVLAHATSPFTRADTVRACVDAVRSGKHDSAFTAERISRFVWCDGHPVNFDPTSICRTQDLPDTYVETSGVIVFRRDILTRYGRRTGFSPAIVEVGEVEAIDIDTPEDFARAENALAGLQDSCIQEVVKHE